MIRTLELASCVHLERADGVLVVRGDECHEGHLVFLEHPHHARAAELGHLQVEEDEIGMLPSDRADGLFARGRFADDRDVIERAEKGMKDAQLRNGALL